MGIENRNRITRLQEEMKSRGVDMVIVYTADEHGSEYIDDRYKFREYLSGFTGSAGSLLVEKERAILWTDGRYFIQAAEELKDSGIELFKSGMPDVPTLTEYVKKAAEKAGASGRRLNIGTDLKLITVSSFKELEKTDEKAVSIKDMDLADVLWKERPAATANRIYSLPDDVAGKSVGDKLADLRKYMGKLNADSVLISALADVMWLFNIRGSDIMYSPVANSYAYVDMEKAVLFASGKSVDDGLRGQLLEAGVEVREYDSLDDQLRWLKGMRILCDQDTMNAHVYGMLKNNELIDKPSFHYIRKHIKNETECKLAKDWHVKDGLALTKFICRIKKLVGEGIDINEYEAAGMLDDLRKEIKGNRGLSFETISAYGSNGAIVHYSPAAEGSAPLKCEGFLLVDSGGQYEGATTDVTRTIALGELTEEMKRDYTSVLKGVLDLADAVFLEGVCGENLDILARRPIWERHLDYRHGTGHGVGAMLSVHEGPQAFRYKTAGDRQQPAMAEGMITSDEPGIYLEGKYGIRIENLLLCKSVETNEWGHFLGFDVLTLVPYEREAILPEMLTDRQRLLINEYHRTIFYLYSPRLDREEREWLAYVTAQI